MHASTALALLFTTLATALPSPNPNPNPNPKAQGNIPDGSWEIVGSASNNGATTGDLIITGRCLTNYPTSTHAAIDTGVRCRFYRDGNCQEQIGGFEGLEGQGRWVTLQTFEAYQSATCWR